jgi:hypothetical protein
MPRTSPCPHVSLLSPNLEPLLSRASRARRVEPLATHHAGVPLLTWISNLLLIVIGGTWLWAFGARLANM